MAATTTTWAEAEPTPGLCGDYEMFTPTLDETCDIEELVAEISARFEATKQEDCPHFNDVSQELKLITGVNRPGRQVNIALRDICTRALQDKIANGVSSVNWDGLTNIAGEGAENIILDDHFAGNGFLNTEVGNFKQDPNEFSEDLFFYVGNDPTQNDHYPTSNKSYLGGESVKKFRETVATQYLQAPTANLENCEKQAVMCCWGRDRQYADQNGACTHRSCKDKDPGDNSNLCWTDNTNGIGNPTRFIEEEEADIHCHGLAWTNDESDIHNKAKWNTLFYVAISDHMYERGYVESVSDTVPMCGCIEDMPVVSRSDCSKPVPAADMSVMITGPGLVEMSANHLRIEFEQCRGDKYGTSQPKNNDLSSHVNELNKAGFMDVDILMDVYDHIVGFQNPNDNENEQACADAYFEAYGESYA